MGLCTLYDIVWDFKDCIIIFPTFSTAGKAFHPPSHGAKMRGTVVFGFSSEGIILSLNFVFISLVIFDLLQDVNVFFLYLMVFGNDVFSLQCISLAMHFL